MRLPYCHTPTDPEISVMVAARSERLNNERKSDIWRLLRKNEIPFRPDGCSCGKCDIMEYNDWIVGDEACNTKLKFFWNLKIYDEFEKFLAEWQIHVAKQIAAKK